METEYKWHRCQECGAETKLVSWAGNRRGADVTCSKCHQIPLSPERWDAEQYAVRARKKFELVAACMSSGISPEQIDQYIYSTMNMLYGKEPD